MAEDRALASGDVEMVFDVACGFFQVKGFEVEADGDALVESFVGSKAELVGNVAFNTYWLLIVVGFVVEKRGSYLTC